MKGPVAVVQRGQLASKQKYDVDEPPDANASQSQQFTNASGYEPEREAIDAEKSEEDRLEECGDEALARVFKTGLVVTHKLSASKTINCWIGHHTPNANSFHRRVSVVGRLLAAVELVVTCVVLLTLAPISFYKLWLVADYELVWE